MPWLSLYPVLQSKCWVPDAKSSGCVPVTSVSHQSAITRSLTLAIVSCVCGSPRSSRTGVIFTLFLLNSVSSKLCWVLFHHGDWASSHQILLSSCDTKFCPFHQYITDDWQCHNKWNDRHEQQVHSTRHILWYMSICQFSWICSTPSLGLVKKKKSHPHTSHIWFNKNTRKCTLRFYSSGAIWSKNKVISVSS